MVFSFPINWVQMQFSQDWNWTLASSWLGVTPGTRDVAGLRGSVQNATLVMASRDDSRDQSCTRQVVFPARKYQTEQSSLGQRTRRCTASTSARRLWAGGGIGLGFGLIGITEAEEVFNGGAGGKVLAFPLALSASGLGRLGFLLVRVTFGLLLVRLGHFLSRVIINVQVCWRCSDIPSLSRLPILPLWQPQPQPEVWLQGLVVDFVVYLFFDIVGQNLDGLDRLVGLKGGDLGQGLLEAVTTWAARSAWTILKPSVIVHWFSAFSLALTASALTSASFFSRVATLFVNVTVFLVALRSGFKAWLLILLSIFFSTSSVRTLMVSWVSLSSLSFLDSLFLKGLDFSYLDGLIGLKGGDLGEGLLEAVLGDFQLVLQALCLVILARGREGCQRQTVTGFGVEVTIRDIALHDHETLSPSPCWLRVSGLLAEPGIWSLLTSFFPNYHWKSMFWGFYGLFRGYFLDFILFYFFVLFCYILLYFTAITIEILCLGSSRNLTLLGYMNLNFM